MISFADVHKTYQAKSGSVDALNGISFDIEDGEFVFIIGKSGSGKSTLMKCITCEETPDEGEVYIDDFCISDMPRALVPVLRRHIGMVYQDFRLIESKTVSENIAFAGEIVGIPKKNLNQIVQFMLNLVGLKDKADAYPKELSGGEQQRIAIARAMVNNPKLVVADEPTGNLDPETSENIMAILQEINRGGTTVVVCTHDSNLVDRMKKRVIQIEEGLIVRDKRDSKYTEDEEDIPKPITNTGDVGFSFGDDPNFSHDSDYADSFDDEEYAAKEPQVSDFFFGDSPVVAKPAPVSAPVSEASAEDVPEEESIDSIIELTDEPEEADASEGDTAETATTETEETSESEDSEEVTEETEDAETADDADDTKEDASGDSAEASSEDDSAEDTDESSEESTEDNWIEEISLEESDIDLDIQEDDE